MADGHSGKDVLMNPRLSAGKAYPAAMTAMSAMGKAVHDSGLDESLIQLIDIRASQINGCGY